jgi:hypothetical protein
MYRSILNQVFPEDQFIVEYDDSSSFTDYLEIKTKMGSDDERCALVTINKKCPGEMYISHLDKCGISGSETLKKIEEFAMLAGFKKINLYDASRITICGYSVDLAKLKILTKGESWYNSLGYKSENYDNEKKNNEAVIKKTLKEIFSDPNLGSNETYVKSSIISLLKNDDLTEEDLENHTLQSISNMLLNLASDCQNRQNEEEPELLLSQLITFINKDSENPMIEYNKNLTKTLYKPPRRSDRLYKRDSIKTSRIISKASKNGGSTHAKRRKKYLKRKTLRK